MCRLVGAAEELTRKTVNVPDSAEFSQWLVDAMDNNLAPSLHLWMELQVVRRGRVTHTHASAEPANLGGGSEIRGGCDTQTSGGSISDIFANYASYYCCVMTRIDSVLSRATSEARHCIQITENDSIVYDDDDEKVMAAFQKVLEKLLQSNTAVMDCDGIDIVLQIVRNNRGGVQRKLEMMLDAEVLKKQAGFLYVPQNSDNQLCLAISLISLLDPLLSEDQILHSAWRLHHAVGLNDQTPVSFDHISKCEEALNRKIVVFFRNEKDHPISPFETNSPKSKHPLYLYLSNNYYSGIRNVTGFLGKLYICHYCYHGDLRPERHSCPGHSVVCNYPDCVAAEGNTVLCSGCNKWYRSLWCPSKHREKQVRQGRLATFCDLRKKCLKCGLFYEIPMVSGGNVHKCHDAKCNVCGVKLSPDSTVLDLGQDI